MAGKDYYEILGVDKKAPKDDIKRAFRTLAHKYHPDKKTGDDAKFKEINEAYSVLGDDSKRAQYDQFGHSFAQEGPTGGAGANGFNGFDFSQFTQGGNGNGFEFDFGDIFGDVFGGNSRRAKVKRGRDISIDLELSFEDSVFGVERTVLLNKVSKCDNCAGSGAEKGSSLETCNTCNGKGTLREVKRTFFGQFESTTTCEICNGSGKTPKVKCHVCHGRGILKKESEIKVKIPAGIDNGEMIRLSGGGEAIVGGQTGDLYIKVYVKKHPLFRKEGVNLLTDMNVKLTDALLGGEEILKTLDGDIKVKIPESVTHGETLRIKGRGIPYEKNHRGDILIKLHITIPRKLSKEAKKTIESLKKEGI
ncbi:MAG: molecular chaperone DnaJ [Candidatus Zambryskibacteria bacterium RIFCSPHIGHO2_12_FULL_39_47]|nr:MAG: molecular chaperone DnaJ [Candidatus Zambryskibacteria bacterium RIFCSPHIGHO2_12_FULL_39_47]